MIDDKLIEEYFFKKVDSSKKINVPKKDEVKVVVHELFKYIHEFNSIERYDTTLHNHPFDKIEVLPELQDFIIPKSVCFDPLDKRCNDLLVHDTKVDWNEHLVLHSEKGDGNMSQINSRDLFLTYVSDEFDLSVLATLQARFRSYFKKEADGLIPLSNIKVDQPLSAVISKLSPGKKGKVHNFGEPYIPYLAIAEVGSMFKDSYYNDSYDEILKEYFSNPLF